MGANLSNKNINDQAFFRKLGCLPQYQNGFHVYEELLEVGHLRRSYSRARKTVGVVEVSCDEIFELVRSRDGTQF